LKPGWLYHPPDDLEIEGLGSAVPSNSETGTIENDAGAYRDSSGSIRGSILLMGQAWDGEKSAGN
jgi:hypothetical protein